MTDQRLDNVVVDVDGAPLPVDVHQRLMLVRVEESVQLPDSFVLHFDDPHFDLFDADRFRLGSRIRIAFKAETDTVVVTAGEITAISVEPGVTGRHELVLAGLDLTHRLARGPKSRSFVRMTESAIAARIAGEYGLAADIDGTDEVREYVLQANETDYAFLRRLAGRIGYDFWITERKFHFKRKPGGRREQSLTWGQNLYRFKVRFASAEHCDEVVVTAWNPLDKRTVTGRSADPDHGTDAPAAREMADAARRAFGRVTRTAGQFPAASQAEATALAESLLLRASGGEVVLRGEAAGNPWLGAGADVRLDNVGQRLAGKYRLTSVEHLYGSQQPYVTRFVSGGKEAADMADLLLGNGSGAGEKRSWGSLVVGVVTNNDDPDGLCRVKVRFPTLSDADESTWARLAAPGIGPARGMQWLPEVGDEVLIGFELDDKNRPVVLGGLWSRRDKPPQAGVARGGKVDARVLASRRNHRLVVTDDPTGAVELVMGDASSALRLKKDESQLNGEQNLVVSAAQVRITASQKVVIDAPQVEITAKSMVKVSGKPIKLN